MVIGTPNPVYAHPSHGDEFQAEGGINRVQVNPKTDPILGIQITPIQPATNGSAAVLIPVTAVVAANEKKLVFVQYENFYEPVSITTGATRGELIEVTTGLAVGDQLVTQGSLSLYAESRKTQSVDMSAPANVTHAQADAQGIPHSHDAKGNLAAAEPGATHSGSRRIPVVHIVLGVGAAVGAFVTATFALLSVSCRQKRTFSSKRGGF